MKQPNIFVSSLTAQQLPTLYIPKTLTPKESLVLYTIWKLQIVQQLDKIIRSTIAINCRIKKNHVSQILNGLQKYPLENTYIVSRSCFIKEGSSVHYNAYSLNLNTFVTSGPTAIILILLKKFPISDIHICREDFKNYLLQYELFSSIKDFESLLEYKLEWFSRDHIRYIYVNKNLPRYIFPHERISSEMCYLKYIALYYIDNVAVIPNEEKCMLKNIINTS